MFVMEPANDENTNHSHIAYKLKQKLLMFENTNGMII